MQLQRRIRQLSRVLSFNDSIRLATKQRHQGEISVRIQEIKRDVTLRTGTSDIECFEKVFLYNEYSLPFPWKTTTIVDAGANIGMATLYFAHAFPQASIVAVEPELSNYKALERNCSGMRQVQTVNAALWPVKCDLTIKDQAAEKWSFSVKETYLPEGQSTRIPAITVPELMERCKFSKIDILKLDIESAEKELFASNSELWLKHVGLIVIELHDRYLPGCAREFYRAIQGFPFAQEVRGENIFVKLNS